jgi:hypothetical protein
MHARRSILAARWHSSARSAVAAAGYAAVHHARRPLVTVLRDL